MKSNALIVRKFCTALRQVRQVGLSGISGTNIKAFPIGNEGEGYER